MNEYPIQALMKTTLESLKEMIDVNTIVGEPVETPDGTTVIPISRVSFGFASGGGEYKYNNDSDSKEDMNKFPFAGGTGAGVSVQPVAFMIVGNNKIKLVSVDQNANMFESLVNLTSKFIDKLESKGKDEPEKRIENKN
ncbi:GerW family sporulation protein [Caminicella sporogenes]|nr:GerW family sporulation protein [Caminicella sporogenes]RKD27692.1 sporulation protein YtfJ [Caminicella sporogenes]WIF96203.1 GerW family sporulation protein [Caminicella sporogenes]